MTQGEGGGGAKNSNSVKLIHIMNVGGLYIVLNILNILISFWIVMKEMSTNLRKKIVKLSTKI